MFKIIKFVYLKVSNLHYINNNLILCFNDLTI